MSMTVHLYELVCCFNKLDTDSTSMGPNALKYSVTVQL